MVEQLLGVLSVAVLVLCYLLVVQAMMAAALLLAQFIALQERSLRALLADPGPVPAPVEGQDQGKSRPSYRLGGDLRR